MTYLLKNLGIMSRRFRNPSRMFYNHKKVPKKRQERYYNFFWLFQAFCGYLKDFKNWK